MDTKKYIIAMSFAAISLVDAEGTEFAIEDWGGPTNTVYSSVSQVPAKAHPNDNGKLFAASRPPVYKPPKGMGSPGGRVGGGSRGEETLTIFALVPNHLGLTIDAQPALYWYLSKPAQVPLILTVNTVKQVKPILETILRTSSKAGIHSVSLKTFNITLELNTEYQWFVSLAMDPKSQSKDIVARGRIKRITPDEELMQKLKGAMPEHVTTIYSEAGLWYDALASISNLCETSPKGNHYCLGRRELLEQVDLSLDLMEIAKAEEGIIVPK